jgi:hypothetical protein|nr:MAG TPA: hypothetical protein [Caudoviricetes sp.]
MTPDDDYRPPRGDAWAARHLADTAYDHVPGEGGTTAVCWLLKAQTHALLHLADQVRVANLVALAAGERTEGTRVGEQAVDALVGQDGDLRPDVARILGVTTGGGDQ